MGKSDVILVANRLPVTITQTKKGLVLNRSIGGVATGLQAIAERYDARWIGWAGLPNKLTAAERANLKLSPNIIDVPIDGKTFEKYYNKLANGVLWPILHNFRPAETGDAEAWAAVDEVVEQFAETVIANCKSDDLIWIHDYHLVTLPAVLRSKGITNRIGFFLHTPFPSPSIFIPWKHHEKVLRGLLAADVIGFQTEKDAAHFKDALQVANLELPEQVIIETFPIGVNFSAYKSALESKKIRAHLQRVRTATKGKRVVLSVSRLDYTKGIVEQIQAFTQAILRYDMDNLLYRLVVAPSREKIKEYRTLKIAIENAVHEANQRLLTAGRNARVDFQYRSHGFEELNAWYRVADIFLVTPLIDGMNLVAKEYVAACDTKIGMLVLSKMAGAAAQLHDAVVVRPDDVQGVADGIAQALNLSDDERQTRWQLLRENVEHEDIFWWADRFLSVLRGEAAA